MSRDNIVALGGGKVLHPDEPVPEVVETLEGLLERARAGEIRVLAYSIATVDGNFSWAWTTEGAEQHKGNLVGAVSMLGHELCSAIQPR